MTKVFQRPVRPAEATSVVGNVAIWDDIVSDKIKDSGISIDDVGLNFSFQNIIASRTITIEENEQMTVHGSFILDGTLIIEGQFVLEI